MRKVHTAAPSVSGRHGSQHGSRTSLDRPMVLLDKVVEIFDWRILMAFHDHH